MTRRPAASIPTTPVHSRMEIQIPTDTNKWTNVTLTWNFENGLASSSYDGTVVDSGIPITGPLDFTEWDFDLSGYNSSTTEKCWIDNFQVTAQAPEPASLLALATGVLGMAAAWRKRR